MRRVLTVLAASAAVMGSLLATGAPHVRAASPTAGTLSASSTTVTWHNPSPMAGSAASKRNQTCSAAPTACDDFSLTIDTGSDAAPAVQVSLVLSGGAVIIPLVYAPGCSTSVTDTSGCYAVEGNTFTLVKPASGVYLVRMACKACPPTSGYTATATYIPAYAASLPPAGNQAFGWDSKELPKTTAAGSAVTSGEPGISVNHLGHIIVNTFGPTVWISTDDGATFSAPNNTIDTTGCPSGDADAVVSEDDTYYADNLCTAGPTNLSYTSRDTGKTWTANSTANGIPSPNSTNSDRQWYATDPKHPGVVYFNYHDLAGPPQNVWILKSTDYGHTWSAPTPVAAGASNYADSSQGNTAARAIIDPTDSNIIDIFYTSNLAQNSATAPPTSLDFDLRQVNLARSTDAGATWTNYLLHDFGTTGGSDNTIGHEFSAATMDTAGNVYIAISERLGNATQTHIEMGVLPKSVFAGPASGVVVNNWVQVDQGGMGANVFPSIAAGDPGNVDVTWYGSTANDNNDTTAQWSEMFSQTFNALDAAPAFTQGRMSGDLPSHVGDVCLAGTFCLVTGGNRNLSDYQSIAIDPCGGALVVYDNDSSGGDTTFVKQTSGAGLLNHPGTACTLAAAGGPATNVAETPLTPLLPVGAVLAVVGGTLLRRRRRA